MITHPALVVFFFIILDVAYFENDAKDMCDQGCMKLSYFENEKEKSILVNLKISFNTYNSTIMETWDLKFFKFAVSWPLVWH